MKKLSLLVSLVLAFAMSVWAQTPSTNDTQSGAASSASQGSQPSSGSQGSMGSQSSGSQTMGSSSQGSMGTAEQGKAGKDHKLKGCLEAEGGSYKLREKDGKEIALTGSADLSQYANHEVAVHGDWASGAGAASSSTADMSKGGGSDKQFTVEKVDSISDTCKGAKKADKDKGMSNNPNPSGPQ
jgi:hypothetical protein